jgi:hypothetical protein
MLLLLICKQFPQHFVRKNLCKTEKISYFRQSNEEINLHEMFLPIVPTCKVKTTERKMKIQHIAVLGGPPPPPPPRGRGQTKRE